MRASNPVVQTGTTLQLRSYGRYSDGTDVDLSSQTTWIGSPLLAIDAGGLATGISAGSTSMSASYFDPIEGVTRLASQAVAVTNASLVSIDVHGQHASVPEGGFEQFEAIGIYSDGVARDLSTQVS